MRPMNDSGTRTKLKKTLELDPIQSSSELPIQGLDQIEGQSLTFEDAKEALNILLAQIGSHTVRKAHKGKIMGYLVLQERRLRTLERRAKNWGYNDESDHLMALANFWDNGA